MAGRRRVAHGGMPREANAAIAGVRSPPLRDEAKRRTGRLTGKARIRRERWFSRRDAVSASEMQGRTQNGARHDYRKEREKQVA